LIPDFMEIRLIFINFPLVRSFPLYLGMGSPARMARAENLGLGRVGLAENTI
jgi:hypothetical protein